MSLQAYYDEFSRCYWASHNAAECGCKGHGWALSDVDTWHECPIHKGMPHPESEPEEPSDEQVEASQEAAMAAAFESDDLPF